MSVQNWLRRALQQNALYEHSAADDVLKERNRVVVLVGVGLLIWLASLAPSRLEALGLEGFEVDPGGVNRGLAVLIGVYLLYYVFRWFSDYYPQRRRWIRKKKIHPATSEIPSINEWGDLLLAARAILHNVRALASYVTARFYVFLRSNRFEIVLSVIGLVALVGLWQADATLDQGNLPAQVTSVGGAEKGGVFHSAFPRAEVSSGPYATGTFTIAIVDGRKLACGEHPTSCRHKPSFLAGEQGQEKGWLPAAAGHIAKLFAPDPYPSRDERRFCELAWTVAHALSKCNSADQSVDLAVRGFAGNGEDACRSQLAAARAQPVIDVMSATGLLKPGNDWKQEDLQPFSSEAHDLAFAKATPMRIKADRASRRVEILVRDLGSCESHSFSSPAYGRQS